MLTHLSLGATHMRQWIGSALVQIMACCLFVAKPLSEPMLDYCQLETWEQNCGEILITIQNFPFTKMLLKIPSAKWWLFCPVGDELTAIDMRMIWYKPRELLYEDWMTASPMTSLTKICWWKFVVTPEVVTTMSRPLVTAKFVSWQVAKFSIWTDAARVISYAGVSVLCYQDAESYW